MRQTDNESSDKTEQEKGDVEMKDAAEDAKESGDAAGAEDKSGDDDAATTVAEKVTEVVADAADKIAKAPGAVADAVAEVADKVTPATPAADKSGSSKSRRKSNATPGDAKRKLNKKGSRARITHTDAKPGDYFFIKLKGYPKWPGIVCSEDMLPQTLLRTRPVTAMKADGTYRDDYADGGKQMHNRTFPVMYLATNEL